MISCFASVSAVTSPLAASTLASIAAPWRAVTVTIARPSAVKASGRRPPPRGAC